MRENNNEYIYSGLKAKKKSKVIYFKFKANKIKEPNNSNHLYCLQKVKVN
jgi:hypothetical protein